MVSNPHKIYNPGPDIHTYPATSQTFIILISAMWHDICQWTLGEERNVLQEKKSETETTVFQGNVDVFEALGSYGVMMVSILGESITLLTDPEDRYQHNDKVSLKFDPKTFHFFDINNGQNLI